MSSDTDIIKKRTSPGAIYAVVESVILGMSVVMLAWTANKVVELSNSVAALNSRVGYMESHGSPTLQTTIADLREIKAVQGAQSESLRRIETALIEHMKKP